MQWQPSASIETLRQRAQLMASIRAFFCARDYLEVETPIMSQYGVSDVYLSNIEARFRGRYYALQTSPEYHMKRLLAAGSGSIFQLIRAFRDDELGRWHNPEFTMLEWYKIDSDHLSLLAEVDELLQCILCCPPLKRKTYQAAFLEICEIDPFHVNIESLKGCLNRFNLSNVLRADEEDPDQYLFLLMTHVVEPALASESAPVALYDFPPSQAALAQIKHGFAERFEVYYQGVELANGFHELLDASLQQQRFEDDLEKRAAKGLPQVPLDENFLAALHHGLPACSGVALGVDRLISFALGKKNIAETLAFDFMRA